MLFCACEDEPPQFTLQQVMLEIDRGRKDVERALATGGWLDKVEESAQSMAWWARDAAFERYIDRADIPAHPGRFPPLQAEFQARLDELVADIETGDVVAAREAYPRLLSTCEACHAVYRPDLVGR